MSAQSKWQRLPTEQINPATINIDTLPLSGILDVMIDDARAIVVAIEREKAHIEAGASMLVRALERGGRLIFVGAGTSGRLGVLEAAEMPPTFGVSPKSVVAIMAGGKDAVHRAKEGVEDDAKEGARAIEKLRPAPRDVVIGISASGVTPFVRAALERAARARTPVLGVTCDPNAELGKYSDVLIALAAGPEVIAGSTRLKAGTVTKVALNMLTTSAMIKVGKTYGNLMVDVQSNSAKLRDRGRRIVAAATDLDPSAAGPLLKRAGGDVKIAIVMQKSGVSRARAADLLRAASGSVRAAIAEAARPRPDRR